jgi:hypothetical protein
VSTHEKSQILEQVCEVTGYGLEPVLTPFKGAAIKGVVGTGHGICGQIAR